MVDYLLERKLREEAPLLHQNMRDNVFVLENSLQSFLKRFPSFTDHSILHSMDVLAYCNELIGRDQIRQMSAAECYILIMGCYLHDIGMGINDNDFEEFSGEIDFGDYFENHPDVARETVIRDFHSEFSGCFIRKYRDLFDIPSDHYLFGIIAACRGHRKTDLYNEEEFPILETGEGTVCLPWLAAVLRLADEIDVTSERNPMLLYSNVRMRTKKDVESFGTNESILGIDIEPDEIALRVRLKSPEFLPLVEDLADKIRNTLDYCREVAAKRSRYRISQSRVTLVPAAPDIMQM
ncbi:MAG: hypothetical protein Q4D81_10350 [Eubacteriales bacterium]|nr:hypothetical protein [Eubacteriales bacterium]